MIDVLFREFIKDAVREVLVESAVNNDMLLTAEQFAQRSGLSKEAVYRLGRRGAIKAVRVGPKTVRFPLSELANLTEKP